MTTSRTTRLPLLCSALLLGLSTATSATAAPSEAPRDEARIEQNRELGGMLGGAATGALVAGPPGAIFGAIVGAIIGDGINNEKGRERAEASHRQLAQDYRSLQRSHEAQSRQLAALEQAKTLPVALQQSMNALTCCEDSTITLHFTTGSARVENHYRSELAALASLLREHPDTHVEISGHADARGNSQDNLKLSEQRVQAVSALLSAQGLKPDRIHTRAHGAGQPLSTQDDVESLFFDRRVQVRVLPARQSLVSQSRE